MNLKRDPIENTEQYLKIKDELEEKIKCAIGAKKRRGYCHLYWRTKKQILQKDYGIEWHSPAELNPDVRFD